MKYQTKIMYSNEKYWNEKYINSSIYLIYIYIFKYLFMQILCTIRDKYI
jgi:hypothetical protein